MTLSQVNIHVQIFFSLELVKTQSIFGKSWLVFSRINMDAKQLTQIYHSHSGFTCLKLTYWLGMNLEVTELALSNTLPCLKNINW